MTEWLRRTFDSIRKRIDAHDVVFALGCLLAAYGVSLWSSPAAFVFLGLTAMTITIVREVVGVYIKIARSRGARK